MRELSANETKTVNDIRSLRCKVCIDYDMILVRLLFQELLYKENLKTPLRQGQICSNAEAQSRGSQVDSLATEESWNFGLFGGTLTKPTSIIEGGFFFYALVKFLGSLIDITEGSPDR